ncbi:translation initiation factor IF-2-like [Tachyglossus aculeatus]|uniref:translation initiation factor IF-2-like n=1 Tax=Tachyglossus aculeatus TaxID=9261 RepID=UPI0018F6B231|nr:translation initiation factor IF-2-like [Tachyglossus aculeatus]
MGRLDDPAKRRIVELRKAGLSFRRIQKVLELDNIRVTPQAVYLFLKRKNLNPRPAQPLQFPHVHGGRGGRRAGPGDEREPEGEGPGGEEGIRIVSVTSLSRGGDALGDDPGPPKGCPDPTPANSDPCPAAIGQGDRLTAIRPGPATPASRGRGPLLTPRSPALIVRKKIVDRALLLQKKAGVHNHQGGSSPSPLPPLLVGSQPTGPCGSLTALPRPLGPSPQVKDVGTQTGPGPLPPWAGRRGGEGAPAAGSARGLWQKLETLHRDVQALLQGLQGLSERQGRLERQQEQQRRCQRETLATLQQLSGALTAGASAGVTGDPPASTLPGFSQFKMELL